MGSSCIGRLRAFRSLLLRSLDRDIVDRGIDCHKVHRHTTCILLSVEKGLMNNYRNPGWPDNSRGGKNYKYLVMNHIDCGYLDIYPFMRSSDVLL